jgi:signal transduction histidine kinase/CheY-like chemotaxis protein
MHAESLARDVDFFYLRIMHLLALDIHSFTAGFWWVFVALLGGTAVWFFRALLRPGGLGSGDLKAQLDIVEYFSQSVFRQNTPEDVLWDIASSCIHKLGLEDCVIYLKDPVREVWVQKAAYGPKNIDYRAIHEPMELRFGEGIVGRVGKTGVAEIIDDTAADPAYVVDDARRGSEVAVPILCDGEVIGVIDSEHTLTGFFKPFHLRVLQNIANICGQKIGRSLGEQRIEEFAKFFELNPNPVARIRKDGQVMLANSAASRAFGSGCVEGQTLSQEHPLWELIEAHRGGTSVVTTRLAIQEVWFQVTLSFPEADSSVEVFAVDVSEVEMARSQAAQAERHKSDFLSVMSHEIRTPLNAILGLIELLNRGDANDESRRAHLSYMEFAGKHLQGLLTDVLDLERLDRGKETPHVKSFSPRELFKRVVNGFQNRASATGNTLTLVVREQVPLWLVGDVGWITQMLNNLVANALKFTDAGEVECLVGWEQEALVLEVRDTGKGISEADLARILEPFEQVRRAEVNVANEGVGLGLAITKRLVDLHGGALDVQTKLGVGSTFVIRLPLELGESRGLLDMPDAGSSGPAIPEAPVLIVDDNELNVLVAQRMVANWGYSVVTAQDSDVAEELLRQSSPFLVLLDIHMPGRDGFQTVQDWRAENSPWRELPVVGLTADAELPTRRRALESGMDDVVVKPFNPPHLRSVIEYHAVHGRTPNREDGASKLG